jgi:hypothetical protein
MKQLLLFLLATLVFTGCNDNRIARQNAVLGIKQMGELVTTEYTITKIIRASDNTTWYKLGDRKILMSCRAHLKAGIDLTAFKESDFMATPPRISIRMPPAKLISLHIAPEDIRVEYQEIGFFRSEFKTGERDALAAQAETQIRNSIDSLGILRTANVQAEAFIRSFLERLGYTDIAFETDKTTSSPNLN